MDSIYIKYQKKQWDDNVLKSVLYANESLFKSRTYHSEEKHIASNIAWVLRKGEDLILYPKFHFFHSANATFILANGKQAIPVKSPYQFTIEINYFDI